MTFGDSMDLDASFSSQPPSPMVLFCGRRKSEATVEWKNSQVTNPTLLALLEEAQAETQKLPPTLTDDPMLGIEPAVVSSASRSTNTLTRHRSRRGRPGTVESESPSSLPEGPRALLGALKDVSRKLDAQSRREQHLDEKRRRKETALPLDPQVARIEVPAHPQTDRVPSATLPARANSSRTTAPGVAAEGNKPPHRKVSQAVGQPLTAYHRKATEADDVDMDEPPDSRDSADLPQTWPSPESGSTSPSSSSDTARRDQHHQPPRSRNAVLLSQSSNSLSSFAVINNLPRTRSATPASATASQDDLFTSNRSAPHPKSAPKLSADTIRKIVTSEVQKKQTVAHPNGHVEAASQSSSRPEASQNAARPTQRRPALGMRPLQGKRSGASAPTSSQRTPYKIPSFKPPSARPSTSGQQTSAAATNKTHNSVSTSRPQTSPTKRSGGSNAAVSSSKPSLSADADMSFGDTSFDIDQLEEVCSKYDNL